MKALPVNTIPGIAINPVQSRYIVRITFAILLLLWCTGNFYPIIAARNINIIIYAFLNHTYSNVCHQAYHKLILIDGSNTLLCARCTGLYLGALFMAILLLMTNIKKIISLKPLIIAALILLLDVILVNINLYKYSSWFAFTSGFLFGAVIYIYIIQVFEEYLNPFLRKQID